MKEIINLIHNFLIPQTKKVVEEHKQFIPPVENIKRVTIVEHGRATIIDYVEPIQQNNYIDVEPVQQKLIGVQNGLT